MLKNISVLVSGGGTNLQAVIDSINEGRITNARINLVISSNPEAYALNRAEEAGIKTLVIGRETLKDFPEEERESKKAELMLHALRSADTDLIVLAGYMSILPPQIVREYEKKIINIHPSLIPKHCGKGYYGKRVHESVIESGDCESGATVHFVDEGVDTGEIILQEKIDVLPGETANELAARVLSVEHHILTEAINMIMDERR